MASLVIAACAGIFLLAAQKAAPDLFAVLEAKTLDLRFRLRPPLPSRTDILFLEIDAPALHAVGRWPWSREIFAGIIDTLHALQAKAVIFDVIFSEPSSPGSDLRFAESVKKAGNVYLGTHFDLRYSPEDIARDAQYKAMEKELSPWFSANPSADFSSAPGMVRTLAGFSEEERKTIFAKLKLEYLFGRNAEMVFDEAMQFFEGEDPAGIRPLYYESKSALLRRTIEGIYAAQGGIAVGELAQTLGIFDPEEKALLERAARDVAEEMAFAQRSGRLLDKGEEFFAAAEASYPIPELNDAMAGSGHLNAVFDQDGTLRRVPLFVQYKGRAYPHLALRYFFDTSGKEFAWRTIPRDDKAQVLLNWRGKWQETFRHLSISRVYQLAALEQEEILAGPQRTQERDELRRILGPQIKDAVCIIGLTAPGTEDFLPTPLETNYPAVGAYATLLSSLQEGRFLSKAPAWTGHALVVLLAVAVAVCAQTFSAGASLLCAAGIMLLYCVAAQVVFCAAGVWIDVVAPLASAALSYVGVTGFYFSSEEKEKRWIRKAFSRYISRSVMEEILKDPSKLKLGGEERELTLLFADIRGFTPYTEKHAPEEVVAILNEYLEEMSRIVLAHDGTLDKYVGDEIVVIFGAPCPQEDHAVRAVAASLEMVEGVRRLREKWQREGKEPLDIGIGINTGKVIVGNIGSSERMNYTAIGDAVNLAARIQGLTREFDNHVMISEYTFAKVKGRFEVKPLEQIRVKGKEAPVMMYEVTGLAQGPEGPAVS